VKGIPSWVTYSVLRLILFAVPLAILLILRIDWWIAVIAAALIGLCLSYILLRKPRDAVARDLYAVRHRNTPATTADDDSEDAAIDAAEQHAAEHHTAERPAPSDRQA
jgi:ABC-type nickel/cobalt efflux system permease component RcnA